MKMLGKKYIFIAIIALIALAILGLNFPQKQNEIGSVTTKTPVLPDGVIFPNVIRNYELRGFHDFEIEQPGLGYSVTYKNSNGSWISIYAFTFNQPDIVDGIESQLIHKVFEMANEEVYEFERRGEYKKANLISKEKISFGQSAKAYLMSEWELNSFVELQKSYTFVTGYNRKIVKVRMTFPVRALPDESKKSALDFLDDFSLLLSSDKVKL